MSYAAYRILLWRYGTVSDLQTAGEQLDATMAWPVPTGPTSPRPRATARGARQPHRGGGHRLRRDRRRARGRALQGPGLHAGQRAARGRQAGHGHERPEPLAAAGPRAADLPERPAHPGPGPDVHRPALGPRHVVRAAAVRRRARRSTRGRRRCLGDAATDQAFKDEAVEIIRRSSQLDATNGETIDISPGAFGDNTLGANDGDGHDVNPATGQPYEPHVVLRADFARALAEYWADGPKSETPPGHWNVIANEVADTPGLRAAHRRPGRARRSARVGRQAVPGAQRRGPRRGHRDLGRQGLLRLRPPDLADPLHGRQGPVAAIRPGLSYDPEGLPLEPGLIEVVTAAIQSRPAAGTPALGAHSARSPSTPGAGSPRIPKTETSGVGWIRAVDWVPYQRATFVTPAFAGYPSGHSTFSRAAAEVLTAFTGDAYFPGGLTSFTARQGRAAPRGGPDRGHHHPVGDLLRRGRPGRHLAAVHGHPRAQRRPRGPQDRRDLRQGRDGPGPALLRRTASARP